MKIFINISEVGGYTKARYHLFLHYRGRVDTEYNTAGVHISSASKFKMILAGFFFFFTLLTFNFSYLPGGIKEISRLPSELAKSKKSKTVLK